MFSDRLLVTYVKVMSIELLRSAFMKREGGRYRQEEWFKVTSFLKYKPEVSLRWGKSWLLWRTG